MIWGSPRDLFGLNFEVPVGLRLGVQWRSKRDSIFDRFPIILGSPGEASWEALGGPFWIQMGSFLGAFGDHEFGHFGIQNAFIFDAVFRNPPGSIF